MEQQAKTTPARRWLVAALTLALPGLGHLYLGRVRQAALVYCGAATILLLGFCLTFATLTGWALTLVVEGLWVGAAAVHGLVQAGRQAQSGHRWFTRWPAALGLAAAALLTTTCGVPRILLHFTRYGIVAGDSPSMAPTFEPGDRSIYDSGYYRRHPLLRQDLIFFEAPEAGEFEFWIKRCVALEGDVVEIRDGVFHLNGQPEPEGPWNHAPAGKLDTPLAEAERLGPLVVPAGMVFCLGDNRGNSYDSRFWGPLPRSSIRGKILYTYWPNNRLQARPKASASMRSSSRSASAPSSP